MGRLRAPREVYRVFDVDEFLDADEVPAGTESIESSHAAGMAGARQHGARGRLLRVAAATVSCGACGALCAVVMFGCLAPANGLRASNARRQRVAARSLQAGLSQQRVWRTLAADAPAGRSRRPSPRTERTAPNGHSAAAPARAAAAPDARAASRAGAGPGAPPAGGGAVAVGVASTYPRPTAAPATAEVAAAKAPVGRPATGAEFGFEQ
jgi:hypothetical protein